MRFKTKLKKYEEGSVFELKINSEKYKNYNDKYIYLIKTTYPYNHEHNSIFMYSIIADRTDVNSLNNIDENKIVKVRIEPLEMRFFPMGMGLSIKEKEEVPVFPDEFDYIYENMFIIDIIKDEYEGKFNYLGKIDFNRPKHDFIPFSEYNLDSYYQYEHIGSLEDYLIEKYEDYNLRKSYCYKPESVKEIHKNAELNSQVFKSAIKFMYTDETETTKRSVDEMKSILDNAKKQVSENIEKNTSNENE